MAIYLRFREQLNHGMFMLRAFGALVPCSAACDSTHIAAFRSSTFGARKSFLAESIYGVG